MGLHSIHISLSCNSQNWQIKAFVYILQKPRTQGKQNTRKVPFFDILEELVIFRGGWGGGGGPPWVPLRDGEPDPRLFALALILLAYQIIPITSQPYYLFLVLIMKICRITDSHQNAIYTKSEVQKLHGSLQGFEKQISETNVEWIQEYCLYSAAPLYARHPGLTLYKYSACHMAEKELFGTPICS